MSYLVLARKFRPQTFSEVSGQEHVTRTLINSIKRDHIAHAYLFAGPRGVGKTSIARIFSKALNCSQGTSSDPCSKCSNCNEITAGHSLAVREIDGASHNSVDNVRELIESFRSLPPPGWLYKVYIIDEVHMLSIAAFNALLKSLEEPPPNTVFILATTEVHKIPETVISRCQRHDFRALTDLDITSRLQQIVKDEHIKIEPEALRMITRLSEGSMRDAQSLLERVRAFCEDKIRAEETGRVLGTVGRIVFGRLIDAVLSRDSGSALLLIDQVFSGGVDPTLFLKDFVAYFRELLLAKFGGLETLKQAGFLEDEAKEVLAKVQNVSPADLQDLVQLAREGADSSLRSAYPRYGLEALVVRMATRQPVMEVAELLTKFAGQTSGSGGPNAGGSGLAGQSRREVSSKISSSQLRTEAPKKTETESPSTPEPAVSTIPLIWADFVKRIAGSGAVVMAENLRRLSVAKFESGRLEATGPQFVVAYLLNADNKTKLDGFLKSLYGTARWEMKISTNESSTVDQPSLQEQEDDQRKRRIISQRTEVSNHPKISALKKAFPGSKIEQIKLKED